MSHGGAATTAVVDVPSGVSGFVLVMRLNDHYARNRQSGDGSWHVHVELDSASVPALISTVEQWQRSERVSGTTVHVSGEVHRVGPPLVTRV